MRTEFVPDRQYSTAQQSIIEHEQGELDLRALVLDILIRVIRAHVSPATHAKDGVVPVTRE